MKIGPVSTSRFETAPNRSAAAQRLCVFAVQFPAVILFDMPHPDKRGCTVALVTFPFYTTLKAEVLVFGK
ncbi:hypothetical protein MASR1M49_05760 [Pararhodobacter aggregans]